MKDKFKHIGLLFLLTFKIAIPQTVAQKDTLFWDKGIKLKKQDFKLLLIEDTNYYNSFDILLTSPISYYYNWNPKKENSIVDIYCLFNRRNSWITDTTKAKIEHEQIHFDIAEIYVREIRQKLAIKRNQRNTNYNKYVRIINRFVHKAHRMQNRYDEETNFGKSIDKHHKWRKKIDSLLASKEHYYVEKQ